MLVLFFESAYLIHINFLDNKGLPTSITFAYGHPELARRAEVWHQLLALKTKAHPQWICIGDFNQILFREEKFSFTQGSIVGANLLQQFISNLNQYSLSASRQRYIWMNNREDADLVMERLDRAFVSIDWLNQYPSYSLRNLPIVKSDYGPIILDFDTSLLLGKCPLGLSICGLLILHVKT